MSAHTPTPWHVFDPTARYPGIDGYGDTTVIVHGFDDETCGVRGTSHATALANAAFIVRAVNAHDDLVAALKDVKQWLGADLFNSGDVYLDRCKKSLALINAALAKAGA